MQLPIGIMMKNGILVNVRKLVLNAALFAGFAISSAFAQSIATSAVPANTLKAFQATTAGAQATWMAGPSNTFEASFAKEGQKMVYCYDQAGLLQQKKIVSNVSAFPASVNASLVASYPKGNVEYAYKVVSRTNQKYFEVQVANANAVDRMRFDLEGKPIGKTSMAAAKPAQATPSQSIASQPVSPKPSVTVASKPVTASATQPVVTKPLTQPSVSASKPLASNTSPTKASPPAVAMRGEAASTTKTIVAKDDLLDDDMDDLEDDGEMDDLFKDDESWDDVDLTDDLDDDTDLLDGTDDLDDTLDLDEDLDDDDL